MAAPKKPADKQADKVKYLELNGQTYELKSLKVAPLRRFMRRFSDLTTVKDDDPTGMIDVLFDCAAIAMSKEFPDETAYVRKIYAGEVEDITDEDREAWGEIVDMDDVALINEHRAGVSLKAPNLLAEATETEPQEVA